MAITCDHERPALNLPQTTPPQLGWQVPSYLSPDPNEFRRQVLEALQGIYLEQSRRFATPAIIPLLDVSYDIPPGSVIRGVADGQTINLLPPALGSGPNSVTPTTFIIDDVVNPITVTFTAANGQPTSTTIGVAGVHDFVPGTDGGYQTPPGSSGPLGSGVTSDRLLGRDTAGTGPVEEIALESSLTFTGGLTVGVDTAGPFTWTALHTFSVGAVDGDPGFESDSVTINGTAYTSYAKVSDIGDAHPALVHFHKHATGAGPATQPIAVFTRTNSDTSAHVVVTDGQGLGRTYYAGHDGTDYALSAFMGAEVDGTPGNNDMPGRLVLGTSPSGSQNPVERMRINAGGALGFGGANFGATGQVLKSQGVSAVPQWQDDTDTTYTAGDGLDLVANEFAVDVSDFAGAGLVDDGSNNLAVGAGAGISVAADSVALADIADEQILANISGVSAAPSARNLSAFAGDNLSYNATTHAFDVQTPDVSGGLFVAWASDASLLNERVAASSTLINVSVGASEITWDIATAAAGPGLTGGGGTALAVGAGDGIDVSANAVAADVSDFAGQGLEDDGANNLRISTAAAGGGLGGGGGVALFVQSSLDSNARVGVRESAGTTFLRRRISFIEGANVSINVADDAGSEEVDVTIAATDTNTTYTAGDGIDLSGTTFLADVSDFAGTGIEDDGANNLRIASAAAGAGLTGGGGSALAVGAGDGITVNANDVAVNASALAGTGLNASSNNLNVDPVLDSTARVIVRANSGAGGGTRRRLNFIAGTGIEITVTDDAGSEEVDITITSTGL